MNGRTIARILLVVFLIAGAIGIGVTAYNAGVAAGIAHEGTLVVSGAAYPVAPYAGWGWGWGFGFPFFGFIGFFLFLFLFIGLFRAAFGRGRRGPGPGRGWSGGGYPGQWQDASGRSWEDRAREVHDAWHRSNPNADHDQPATGSDRPTAG